MSYEKNLPPSLLKWDSTAKIGLGVILAALLLLAFILANAIKDSGKQSDSSAELIPEDAATVGLSESKLEEITQMLSPLLRGDISSFDGTDSLNSGEAVSALLAYLCLENSYTAEGDAYLIPAADVDALYASLFGTAPPRGDISGVALYNSETELYSFSGSVYHPEYVIDIVSARSLDKIVYIHALVKEPVESEQTESADIGTEETKFNTVRNVIFTLNRTNDSYTVTEMRDA